MKFTYKLILAASILIFVFPGCEKMLEVDSNRFLKTNQYTLNSPNQGIYAMSGIFDQLQKIAERYVILGELRGDLMDVTSEANENLQQINNFEMTPDNPYANLKDYYAVINNCNYLIQNIDTSKVSKGEKSMYPYYAATKAIRAWTYMQIALNYGKAFYFEKPLLTLDDAVKTYPQYNISELANVLIPDLQPWKDIIYPDLGTIGELNTAKSYFPIRFLLGELYLWSNQYEMAAIEYHDLIFKQQAFSNSIQNIWSVIKGEFVSYTFYYYSNDIISVIGTSSEHGEGSHLKSMSLPVNSGNNITGGAMIKPSVISIYNWDNQTYYDTDTLNRIQGDLRGIYYSYYSESPFNFGKSTPGYFNYIYKYYTNDYQYKTTEIIPTCSNGLLYLRYAEAVNRLGKPNLAFAVLKNGLNKVTMANRLLIPASEISPVRPSYMNFDTTWFDKNIGIHARGCGYVANVKSYAIPSLPSTIDSISFVEDKINLELALETAFNGNRFQDLMRFALRRNDPSYLANAVAEKYTGSKELIRSKLMDVNNWYLPVKQ